MSRLWRTASSSCLLLLPLLLMASGLSAQPRTDTVLLELSDQAVQYDEVELTFQDAPYFVRPAFRMRGPFVRKFFRRLWWRWLSVYESPAFREELRHKELMSREPALKAYLSRSYQKSDQQPEDLPAELRLSFRRLEVWHYDGQNALVRRETLAGILRLQNASKPPEDGIDLYYRPQDNRLPLKHITFSSGYRGIANPDPPGMLEQKLFDFRVVRGFEGSREELRRLQRGWLETHWTAAQQRIRPGEPRVAVSLQMPFILRETSRIPAIAHAQLPGIEANRGIAEQIAPDLLRQVLLGKLPLYYSNDKGFVAGNRIPLAETQDLIENHPETEGPVNQRTAQAEDFSHGLWGLSLEGELVKDDNGSPAFQPQVVQLVWNDPTGTFALKRLGRIPYKAIEDLGFSYRGEALAAALRDLRAFHVLLFAVNNASFPTAREGLIVQHALWTGQWERLPPPWELEQADEQELNRLLKERWEQTNAQ